MAEPTPRPSSPGSTAHELALLRQRVAALEARVKGGRDCQQPTSASAPDSDLAVLWRVVDDIAAFSHRLTELEAHVTGAQHVAIKRLERHKGLRPPSDEDARP